MTPACSLERAHGSHGNNGRIAYTLGLFSVEEGEVSLRCLKEERLSVSGCGVYVCLGEALYEQKLSL